MSFHYLLHFCCRGHVPRIWELQRAVTWGCSITIGLMAATRSACQQDEATGNEDREAFEHDLYS